MTTAEVGMPESDPELVEAASDTVTTKDTYSRIVRIHAPANAKWEPDRAQQLATSLFSVSDRVKLVIQADQAGIHWFIDIPHMHTEAVVQSLYASYPNAQISTESNPRSLIGYYVYHIHGAAPFIGPIAYAEDFGKLDPLATILRAMTGLSRGVTISYELELTDPQQSHHALGQKLSTASHTRWWQFLTVGGAAAAATRKALGADQTAKYTHELQRLISEKLHSSYKQAVLAVKIRASSRSRADSLFALLLPGLALYERPTSNLLVPAQEESFPLVLSPREVAALWHLPNEQCQIPGITWAAAISAPAPVSVADQEKGICLGTNLYQGRSQSVWLSYPDRVTHVNVIGKTGTGKSTLLHNMIHQDIAAGKGVAVIDPHGDLVEQILTTSIPREREQDVILFDVSDVDYPVGLNFFAAPGNIEKATVADATLAVIRKMFADSWSSARMEDTLYAALVALQSVKGATIRDVARLLQDTGYRSQVLSGVSDPVVLEFWYEDYEHLSASHQREIARPIVNRLRKFYRNQKIGRIVGQDRCLDFSTIMDQSGIFLAKLTGVSEIEAETLGALLISKLQLTAMSRTEQSPESRKPYYLYVDEVQNLAATSLDVLFSEARKTGMTLVVANQFLGQLQGPILESIMGNVGTTIMFGLGPKDANTLAPFVRPRITSDDLVNLDRFNAVVRLQQNGKTQPAFSVQTQAPLSVPDDGPERMSRIQSLSRSAHARHRDEVDAELLERYQKYQQVDQSESTGDSEDSYFG